MALDSALLRGLYITSRLLRSAKAGRPGRDELSQAYILRIFEQAVYCTTRHDLTSIQVDITQTTFMTESNLKCLLTKEGLKYITKFKKTVPKDAIQNAL